jgi:hypothetical protein
MEKENHKYWNAYSILSAVVLFIGLILLVYMIIVEDEPGALPLLLIFVGTVSLVVKRLKNKNHTS